MKAARSGVGKQEQYPPNMLHCLGESHAGHRCRQHKWAFDYLFRRLKVDGHFLRSAEARIHVDCSETEAAEEGGGTGR